MQAPLLFKKAQESPCAQIVSFWVPFSKMCWLQETLTSQVFLRSSLNPSSEFQWYIPCSSFGICCSHTGEKSLHAAVWTACPVLFSSAHIFKKVRNIQFSSSCFSAASLTLFGSIILICTSFSASEISVSKFPAAETWIGGPDSLILSENRLTRHPNEKFPAWF